MSEAKPVLNKIHTIVSRGFNQIHVWSKFKVFVTIKTKHFQINISGH